MSPISQDYHTQDWAISSHHQGLELRVAQLQVARLQADLVRTQADLVRANNNARRAIVVASRASLSQTTLEREIAAAKALVQEVEEISASRNTTITELRGTLRGERTMLEQLRRALSIATSNLQQLRHDLTQAGDATPLHEDKDSQGNTSGGTELRY